MCVVDLERQGRQVREKTIARGTRIQSLYGGISETNKSLKGFVYLVHSQIYMSAGFLVT